MDADYDAKTICEILDIGPTVLTEWRFAFVGAVLSFFGLKDYSQRQCHLSVEQERARQAHFTEPAARNADEVCAYILAEHEHEQSDSASGAAKLMRRLGFIYKKPQSLPAQADEIKQAAFIDHYEVLMTGLGADEMVVVSKPDLNYLRVQWFVLLFGCKAEWISQCFGLNSPAVSTTEKAINTQAI